MNQSFQKTRLSISQISRGKTLQKLFLVITFVILLQGCGSNSEPIQETSTEQPRVITTPTEAPTYTLVPTQTSTTFPTRTPAPTLLPTLEPERNAQLIRQLLETNGFCEKYCIWGFENEVTPFLRAASFLHTIDGGGALPEKKYDNYFSIDNNTSIEIVFENNNRIVSKLTFSVSGLDNPSINKKDWKAYNLDQILKTYGIPDSIRIEISADPFYYYPIYLLKYDQAMMIFVEKPVLPINYPIIEACPSYEHAIKDLSMSFSDSGEFYPNISREDVENAGVDIYSFTGLEPGDFYNFYIDPLSQKCLMLDYEKFLEMIQK